MKNYLKFSFILASIALFAFAGCVKTEPTEPPTDTKDTTTLTATHTIAQLKALYSGALMEITDSIIVKATLSGNDKSGNIYKTIFVQDATGGLEIKLDATNLFNDYPIGTNIFISAKGMYLGDYNGAIQLGGNYNGAIGRLDQPLIPLHIFKAGDNSELTITNLKISEITDANIATIVKLSGVQFMDTTNTYADAKATANRTLTDTLGNTILVRTSNYANFASDKLPSGNGELTAILSKFGSDYQLYIRSKDDVNLNNMRWINNNTGGNALLNETFDNDLGKFDTLNINGKQSWYQSAYNGDGYAKISGYDNSSKTNYANEDWLISPALSINKNVVFSFKSAINYGSTGDGTLSIYYSTDFDGSNLNSATWNDITSNFTLPAGNSWTWKESGDYTLTGVSGTVYFAFKYVSTDKSAATCEIDNIMVK